jgi:hypothetical protein
MVLVQVLITPSAGGGPTANDTNFVIPVSGKCSIRVLSMVYHATEANTNSRVIQLRSDILYFPYSPLKYLTMISNPSGTLNYDTAYQEYNLQNVVLQGQIRLAVIDNTTGLEPTTFQWCLVSLQIEHINEFFNPSAQ